MDIFLPNSIKYQLYLLQLENYELDRYWKLLRTRGFFPSAKKPLRKELVWTVKARALMLMAAAMHVLIAVVVSALLMKAVVTPQNIVAIFAMALLVILPFYFVLFTISLLLVSPLDAYAKKRIVSQAIQKVATLKKIKIIGIAGSYGKTTMKEVLLEVLGSKFNVAATPESVNTPVGIARWMLQKFDESLNIAIVEMGEHYEGDIKYLCGMVRPDIAVVTGINEAHLERLGSLDTAIKTIFEIVEYAKSDALILLNGDDKNTKENFQRFVKADLKVEFYTDEGLQNKKFDSEKLLWEAEVQNVGKVELPLLGEYALGTVSAAIAIAKYLGASDAEIKMGLLNIKPVEHRLQPIRSAGNVLVIDDSYNGNPAGAAEAIKVLSCFTGRRKIYITPGLVESGEKMKEVHEEIGRRLAVVADVVVLIKNSVTPFIENGMASNRTKIIWFDTAQEAHESLKNILQSGDVVLFQNDWGDQYV